MHPATTARFVTARRSAARLSVAALLLAPTLTSCALISPAAELTAPSHESSAAPTPTQTTPAAPTPSSAPVKTFDPQAPQPFIIKDRQPPVLSDVARQPDGEGAEAFAYFVLDAWVYALSTNDIEWFSANLVGESKTLEDMREKLKRNAAEQHIVSTSISNVVTVDHRFNPEDPTERLIELELDVSSRIAISPDGSEEILAEAAPAYFSCVIRPDALNGWTIRAITLRDARTQ